MQNPWREFQLPPPGSLSRAAPENFRNDIFTSGNFLPLSEMRTKSIPCLPQAAGLKLPPGCLGSCLFTGSSLSGVGVSREGNNSSSLRSDSSTPGTHSGRDLGELQVRHSPGSRADMTLHALGQPGDVEVADSPSTHTLLPCRHTSSLSHFPFISASP